MAKLFAWEQVQTLWTKIKNTFVAKDAGGNVTVTGQLNARGGITSDSVNVTGEVSASAGITSQDHIEVKGGGYVKLYDEDDSEQYAYIACGDDGKLMTRGGTVATETFVTNAVANAVANAPHLKREKVATLPGVATASESVIYMIPATDGSGDDVFDEYMKIDGKLEKIGSNRVNLSGYSTTEQMNNAISTAVSNSYTLITDAEINALS